MVTGQPFLLALVLKLVHVGIERSQFRGADQNFLFAGGRIHVPQLAFLPLLIALHE